MADESRILLKEIECNFCHSPFYLCRKHYRGHRYCSDECRKAFRGESHRESQTKYRTSGDGRKKNSEGAKRRRKIGWGKKNVADQPSTPPTPCIILYPTRPGETPRCLVCGVYGKVVKEFPPRGYGSGNQKRDAENTNVEGRADMTERTRDSEEASVLESESCCGYCGKPLYEEKIKLPFGRKRELSVILPCECQMKREARLRREERVQKMTRILMNRGFQSGKYARMTLRGWQNRPVGVNVVKKALDYIETTTFTGRNWLYLHGGVGVGKTHIAIAIARKMAIKNQWPPAIFQWTDYCERIRQSFRDKSIRVDSDIIRRAPVLVLDDIDNTAPSSWTLSQLCGVIAARDTHDLPTILTASRSIVELSKFWDKEVGAEALSKAIISRVLGQLVKVIHLNGEDYRICGEEHPPGR